MRVLAMVLIALGLLVAGGAVLPSVTLDASACQPVGFDHYEHPNGVTVPVPYLTGRPMCLQ